MKRMIRCLSVAVLLAGAGPVPAASMSFLSLNIRHGVAPDGTVGLEAAEAVIRQANADFVGVQDVDWRAHRSGRVDQAKELGRRCGYHATFAMSRFIGTTPDQQHGVVLLSHEQPLSRYDEFLPGRERQVALFCEFSDCHVGVAEFDADPAARAESEKIVDRIVRRFSAKKPVFMVDACGGMKPYASAVRQVTVETPSVERMDVIPRPADFVFSSGAFSIGAMEPSLSHVRRTDDATVPAEGYRLTVATNGITLAVSDEAGAFYALQTLKQLGTFRWGRIYFPCCTIADAPRFGWRGMMIDDVRHFFGKAAMKRTLELMASHKMNVLHWHLTDSQGWRLPVARRPELAEKGASRPYSTDQTVLADRFEDGVYGPFRYSEADIREIVAFAAARHIRIVPEVDMPGHCRAALRAFPQLSCFPGGNGAPKGAVDDVFCLGKDGTLDLFHDVLDAVMALFPDSKYVHIGGDEVNKVNGKACPDCQARLREIGATDVKALQSWFTRALADYLAKRGRRLVGWDEIILDGEAPEGATIMSWRGTEGGIAAAKAGRTCVMCPHRDCYFNYEQGLKDDPVAYPWWGYPLTLERAYRYDPLAGIPESAKGYVLGGQCCLWSNLICDEMQLQWQTWPRACATAEVFWSPATSRDYADFVSRMAVHRPRLIGRHVNCAPLEGMK